MPEQLGPQSVRGEHLLETRLGLTWDLMLLGGGGNPAAYHRIGGERLAHDSRGARSGLVAVEAGNEYVGGAVETAIRPAADAWWAPIETVSNSEGGFERVYQGSGLLLSWVRTVSPGERFSASVRCTVATARDATADEGPGPA